MFSILYNAGKAAILRGDINPLSDTLKVALVTASYTADKDNHDFFNDVSGEVSGTGYTAGGKTLASLAVTQDNANDRAVLTAATAVWAVASFSARGAVLYKATGNPATSPLLAYMDFGITHTVSGEDFYLEWNPSGIIYLGE
jgi:hypothetical protein